MKESIKKFYLKRFEKAKKIFYDRGGVLRMWAVTILASISTVSLPSKGLFQASLRSAHTITANAAS